MLGFLKSLFLPTSSPVTGMSDLAGHFFNYRDTVTGQLILEVWVQEEPDEEGFFEVITTRYHVHGDSEWSYLVDDSGMIRRDPQFKGRPNTLWLQTRLREVGLSGKMGRLVEPVTVYSKTFFRGLKVWHVQFEDTGMAAYMYFDCHTGIKVAESNSGVLSETSFPMKLPRR